VRYLRLNDLISMRRAVWRPKDLRRADELERLATSGSARAYASPARGD
jgi:hypothetical protein